MSFLGFLRRLALWSIALIALLCLLWIGLCWEERWRGERAWNAYRAAPESQDYISIEDAVQCARDVAGDDHHFRVVQLPYNLAMTEAYTTSNQALNGKVVTILEACEELGVTVMASAYVTMWSQLRLCRFAMAYPATRPLSSATATSSPNINDGTRVYSATVRDVVTSIISLSAGNRSLGAV